MINARDPQNDPDVTRLPCSIGTGDCEDMADGYCEECGKPTCRSCAVELESGLLLCRYCYDDGLDAMEKESEAQLADMPDLASMGMLSTIVTVGCAGYVYVISALVRRWM